MKRNVPVLGLVIGLIFPLVGMVILYLIRFREMEFSAFMQTLSAQHKVAAMVLSLSLLANAVPFIYYTNKRLDLTARGILIATMLYALVIVMLKFIW
jgi:ribonucleotide reductase alpha subunit